MSAVISTRGNDSTRLFRVRRSKRNDDRLDVHYVCSRQTCSGCRPRVFTYADELHSDGTVLRDSSRLLRAAIR
jgi:hypothetical protein